MFMKRHENLTRLFVVDSSIWDGRLKIVSLDYHVCAFMGNDSFLFSFGLAGESVFFSSVNSLLFKCQFTTS